MQVNEFVENLVNLWNNGQLTEVAYQISSIYQGGDYRFISEVMVKFKETISFDFDWVKDI